MEYRPLGRTGIKVSEIGYGAWGIGGQMWQGAVDAESMRALHQAVDLGLNFIDTALVYGDGHSETLVGKFVKERKERIYVASKIPPKNGAWPARKGSPIADAFPSRHIIASTERSLKNLGLETLDVQQFHVWDDGWAGNDEWKRAIQKLKEEGKVRYFGISINDHQPANALRGAETGLIDTVQVIYNIFDQSPEDQLFSLCREKNIGVIVRVPLDEGGLTGKINAGTTFPAGDWRNNYFRGERKAEVSRHVEALKPLLGKESATLPELALRFVLHHPAVSTVIPGMRSAENVRANCGLSDGRRLSDTLVAELRKHAWARNFYD